MTPEKRTSDLVKAVAIAANEYGKDAGKEMVLELAKEDSLTALADTLEVYRPSLSSCLAGKRPEYKIREKLEKHLGLTPGAMTRVLALMEQL